MNSRQTLFLIGPMGSGKSYVGKALAQHFGLVFNDLDDLIEEKTSKSISQIFADSGEDAFRTIEAETLRSLQEPGIIATGGGTPCFHQNMEFINQTGLSIYLRCETPLLAKRLSAERSHRPLIADLNDEEVLPFLNTMLEKRDPFYRQAQVIYHIQSEDTPVIRELGLYFRPFF